jgi:hypothetical protein
MPLGIRLGAQSTLRVTGRCGRLRVLRDGKPPDLRECMGFTHQVTTSRSGGQVGDAPHATGPGATRRCAQIAGRPITTRHAAPELAPLCHRIFR